MPTSRAEFLRRRRQFALTFHDSIVEEIAGSLGVTHAAGALHDVIPDDAEASDGRRLMRVRSSGMRMPRLIAVVLSWAVAATAVYLAMAAAAPPSVIVLVFLAGFAACVSWLWGESYLDRFRVPAGATSAGSANAEADSEWRRCASCGRAIVVDPELSRNVFEGMHWLCFHLEFEHDGDADLPCSDAGCPHAVREMYEAKLRELGADPVQVLDEAIAERYRGTKSDA